jgi:hypothetical protein
LIYLDRRTDLTESAMNKPSSSPQRRNDTVKHTPEIKLSCTAQLLNANELPQTAGGCIPSKDPQVCFKTLAVQARVIL